MSLKVPEVTVLMPVYNGENHLREAIESILEQTFADFEFLIINDGSTDRSVDIVNSYSDPRIRLVHNERNTKLIATLNKGMALAGGKYIARMDCDDISLPERLAKQVAFMDSNSEVGICGTWIKTIGEVDGNVWRCTTDPDTIRCRLLFKCVMAHPSVIMRRELMEKNGLRYDYDYPHAEDYQLWQRACEVFPVANIGEVLLFHRISSQSVSRLNSKLVEKTLRRIDREAISRLGILPGPSELAVHRRLRSGDFENTNGFIEEVEAWLLKLRDANVKANHYPHTAFKKVLGERWLSVCTRASGLGLWTWWKFLQSDLSGAVELSLFRKVKFGIMCGMKRGAAHV